MVKLKRVYEKPDPDDGRRILVDRLWPRGLKKADAHLEAWLKDLAPSTELRQWFAHNPERWEEFRRRYRQELEAPEKAPFLEELLHQARQGIVTLVFAAKDEERNNAVVIKQFLEKRLAAAPASRAG
jgi:uncharacterized protein YeaO (DUF488 family)|uniref:DUF488 domain-containing protein n=1 Tax=Desulfobacca acetoxidans TaxID=60893 RepID=A0A7C3Z840_9BACT